MCSQKGTGSPHLQPHVPRLPELSVSLAKLDLRISAKNSFLKKNSNIYTIQAKLNTVCLWAWAASATCLPCLFPGQGSAVKARIFFLLSADKYMQFQTGEAMQGGLPGWDGSSELGMAMLCAGRKEAAASCLAGGN